MELWLKEVAGSDALRKWSSHDPQKWEEFKRKYEAELKKKQELLRRTKQAEKDRKAITLLYSAKDEQYNNAVALITILKMRGPSLYLTSRAFTA
jgi:uncharacterized protein YeaO (DUF488 family)